MTVLLHLTEREATEVLTLLNVVLTNDDQWDTFDLAALRRAAKKIGVLIDTKEGAPS